MSNYNISYRLKTGELTIKNAKTGSEIMLLSDDTEANLLASITGSILTEQPQKIKEKIDTLLQTTNGSALCVFLFCWINDFLMHLESYFDEKKEKTYYKPHGEEWEEYQKEFRNNKQKVIDVIKLCF